ncbi:hypothetical protein C8F04DRAFT_1172168 [Mycena alexandri]|uniref:Protein kinase domain-containing protein n=1 Tax=Mycena alexandri TaxID=1745969 RepID=A0AAD6XJU2_9AGAR|nr:hypothetical protein C8F04DRAFT_1172168 [Mycena alexandri]
MSLCWRWSPLCLLANSWPNFGAALTEFTRFRDEILRTLNRLTTLEVLGALAESQASREKLEKISTETGISSRLGRQDAFQKHEQYICEALHTILTSAETRQAAIHSQIAYHWQEQLKAHGQGLEGDVRRFLIQLAGESLMIPKEISLRGVVRDTGELLIHKNGGFADIYSGNSGTYEGKKLRSSNSKYIKGVRQPKLKRGSKLFVTACLGRPQRPKHLSFLGVEDETTKPHFCMAFPWMNNGTIMEYLKREGRSRGGIDKELLEVAEGLSYLHSRKIVHGDLRGSTILIGLKREVQLAGLVVLSEGHVGDTGSTFSGSQTWERQSYISPANSDLRKVIYLHLRVSASSYILGPDHFRIAIRPRSGFVTEIVQKGQDQSQIFTLATNCGVSL